MTQHMSNGRLAEGRSLSCRHCGEPLAWKDIGGQDYWTHAHGLYRCQQKVSYGHNAAHPDLPCLPSGNSCRCLYDPDPGSTLTERDLHASDTTTSAPSVAAPGDDD